MPTDSKPAGLKARLEAACEDLWWSSEADYPVEVVWQTEGAIAMVEVADSSDSATEKVLGWLRFWDEQDVEVVDVSNFFKKSTAPKNWHTEEDKAQIARLNALEALLKNELVHLQVYRCGTMEVTVYILGFSDRRVLAGVRTVIVET